MTDKGLRQCVCIDCLIKVHAQLDPWNPKQKCSKTHINKRSITHVFSRWVQELLLGSEDGRLPQPSSKASAAQLPDNIIQPLVTDKLLRVIDTHVWSRTPLMQAGALQCLLDSCREPPCQLSAEAAEPRTLLAKASPQERSKTNAGQPANGRGTAPHRQLPTAHSCTVKPYGPEVRTLVLQLQRIMFRTWHDDMKKPKAFLSQPEGQALQQVMQHIACSELAQELGFSAAQTDENENNAVLATEASNSGAQKQATVASARNIVLVQPQSDRSSSQFENVPISNNQMTEDLLQGISKLLLSAFKLRVLIGTADTNLTLVVSQRSAVPGTSHSVLRECNLRTAASGRAATADKTCQLLCIRPGICHGAAGDIAGAMTVVEEVAKVIL